MGFKSTVFRRAVTASFVTLAVSVSPLLSTIAQAATVLNGAGATFPETLYQRYTREFSAKNPDIRVNYLGIGSGGGIKAIQAGSVDFGGSDAAMTDAEIDKVNQNRGVLLIPTAGGAVSVVYNLPGVATGLKLTQAAVAGIFDGKITNWNDPEIAGKNPGVSLPSQPIKLVVRADSSGTTFVFTNALSSTNPFFKGKIGTSKAPKWGSGALQGKGNPGVASTVQQTPGSIGYVEYSYAKQNNISMASVQNRKGEFVTPSLETTDEALSTIKFPENFRVFEGNPASGYPISGVTWMMVYKRYSADKLEAVKKWMQWVLTDGQTLNKELDFSRIPEDVTKRALVKVNSIKAQ